MARKHRVKANETYDTVAAQYGVGVDTVLNMNPGVISPKGGMYLNVPSSAETSQGAFGFGGGGFGNFIGGAADFVGGVIDYFDKATTLQYPNPNIATDRPVRNPSGGAGNATYLNSERAYAPMRKTNGSVSSGGDGGGFGASHDDGRRSYANPNSPPPPGHTPGEVAGALANGETPQFITAVEAAQLFAESQLTEADLIADGYTKDSSGNWTAPATSKYDPKNPSGNAGGWHQYDDGSWHLAQNGSQQRKAAERKAKEKKARESSAGGATQTQVATWSIG